MIDIAEQLLAGIEKYTDQGIVGIQAGVIRKAAAEIQHLQEENARLQVTNRPSWKPMSMAPTDREILLDVSYWYPGDKHITRCFIVAAWDADQNLWIGNNEGRRSDQINGWMDIPNSELPRPNPEEE